jgi:hypothetical protein
VRGVALAIEVLIRDDVTRPYVELRSTGLRVTAPTAISYEDLMDLLGEELTTDQALELYDIWTNDTAPRVFTQTPEGVVITLNKTSEKRLVRKGSLASLFDGT